MKIFWEYCWDGNNLPEKNSTRVCLFQTAQGPKVESCILVETLSTESIMRDEPEYVWLLKGDISEDPVYPFAWLRIEFEGQEEELFNQLLDQKQILLYHYSKSEKDSV